MLDDWFYAESKRNNELYPIEEQETHFSIRKVAIKNICMYIVFQNSANLMFLMKFT